MFTNTVKTIQAKVKHTASQPTPKTNISLLVVAFSGVVANWELGERLEVLRHVGFNFGIVR